MLYVSVGRNTIITLKNGLIGIQGNGRMTENKIPEKCQFTEGIDTCKLTECSKNIMGMCTKKGSKNYPDVPHRTQFERIKLFDIDEMAEFLTRKTKCVFCDDETMQEKTDCASLKECTEYCKWKQWLQSEVTE